MSEFSSKVIGLGYKGAEIVDRITFNRIRGVECVKFWLENPCEQLLFIVFAVNDNTAISEISRIVLKSSNLGQDSADYLGVFLLPFIPPRYKIKDSLQQKIQELEAKSVLGIIYLADKKMLRNKRLNFIDVANDDCKALTGIIQLISALLYRTTTALKSIDLEGVLAVLSKQGEIKFYSGKKSSGKHRARQAACNAICAFDDDIYSVGEATSWLICVNIDNSFRLADYHQIQGVLQNVLYKHDAFFVPFSRDKCDEIVVFDYVHDRNLEDEIYITMIASGL
jgi:cell division GTPase FtsZ